jgi:L-alanine-DL-glutamate epimerase-like enolase superfamily enzyme
LRSLTIADVRTTVVGTPWRELVFVELVTDEGLVGVGEVRMVNRTDTPIRSTSSCWPGRFSDPITAGRAR